MSELLTTSEACEYLGISRHQLKRLRANQALAYLKLGHKTIKYRRTDLDAYRNNCAREVVKLVCDVCNCAFYSEPHNRNGRPRMTCGDVGCVKAYKKKLKQAYNKRRFRSGNKMPSQKRRYRVARTCMNCGCSVHTSSKLCLSCNKQEDKRVTVVKPSSFCIVCGSPVYHHMKRVCCDNNCIAINSMVVNRAKVRKYFSKGANRTVRAVRTRIRMAFARKSGRSTFEALGYTARQLNDHMERLWESGMDWTNYGAEWHIDHIKPLSWFDVKEFGDAEMVKAWSLSNLAPRWATNDIARQYGSLKEGNIEKSNKYVA